mmetsp:Transcript_58679/g.148701  ORF Transcript_58679/g.148701 Transcript_58679/m.148701 type:complete len:472 (+) Transcript_58679:55-1470(+)
MVCATSLEACQVACVPQSTVMGCPLQQQLEQSLLGKEFAAMAPMSPMQAPSVQCMESGCCYYVIAVPVDASAAPCCGPATVDVQAWPQVIYATFAQEPQEAFPGHFPSLLDDSQWQWFQNQGPSDFIGQSCCDTVMSAGGSPGSKRGPGSALPRRQRRQRALQQQRSQRHAARLDLDKAHVGAADVELAAELTRQLDAGGASRQEALRRLSEPSLMRRLSFTPAGCRAVQLALEVADRSSAAKVAAGLQGSVAEAIGSPNANYVVQKIITVLTPQEAPFIAEELQWAGPALACHEYGCRIYCRLLENAAEDESTVRLIDSALAEVDVLLTHPFGHHVVEGVLEHGLARQQGEIIPVLRKGVMRTANSRPGAYVLEKALLYSSLEDRRALASDVLAALPSELHGLMRSQLGCMVIRAMLRSLPAVAQQVRQQLTESGLMSELETTKHGRRLLASAGLSSVSDSSSVGAREEA